MDRAGKDEEGYLGRHVRLVASRLQWVGGDPSQAGRDPPGTASSLDAAPTRWLPQDCDSARGPERREAREAGPERRAAGASSYAMAREAGWPRAARLEAREERSARPAAQSTRRAPRTRAPCQEREAPSGPEHRPAGRDGAGEPTPAARARTRRRWGSPDPEAPEDDALPPAQRRAPRRPLRLVYRARRERAAPRDAGAGSGGGGGGRLMRGALALGVSAGGAAEGRGPGGGGGGRAALARALVCSEAAGSSALLGLGGVGAPGRGWRGALAAGRLAAALGAPALSAAARARRARAAPPVRLSRGAIAAALDAATARWRARGARRAALLAALVGRRVAAARAPQARWPAPGGGSLLLQLCARAGGVEGAGGADERGQPAACSGDGAARAPAGEGLRGLRAQHAARRSRRVLREWHGATVLGAAAVALRARLRLFAALRGWVRRARVAALVRRLCGGSRHTPTGGWTLSPWSHCGGAREGLDESDFEWALAGAQPPPSPPPSPPDSPAGLRPAAPPPPAPPSAAGARAAAAAARAPHPPAGGLRGVRRLARALAQARLGGSPPPARPAPRPPRPRKRALPAVAVRAAPPPPLPTVAPTHVPTVHFLC